MPTPTGYSGAQAVALVRAMTNRQTTPVDATIYTLLNVALEKVADELDPILAVSNVALNPGDTSATLPTDLQTFERVTYSAGLPTVAGSTEYPLAELGPGAFAEATGFLPTATANGPIAAFRRLTDASGAITVQLYPSSPGAGWLNVYYFKRPLLWDQKQPFVQTDLDTAFQYCVLLKACAMVLPSVGNTRQGSYYENLYREELERKIASSGRRRRVHGSTVRDVSAAGAAAPHWFP